MADDKNAGWTWVKALPRIITIPLALTLLVTFVYLLIFIVRFIGNGISGKVGDWSDTATFMNLVVCILNLVVFVVLSLLVYQYNANRDKNADVFQQSIERPILVFRELVSRPTGMIVFKQWCIKNIGNGPALNLLVTFKARRDQPWQEPVTKCYDLGKDEEVVLSWIHGADVSLVVYKDIFGNKYGSVLVDDISFVEDLQKPSSADPFGIGITAASLQDVFLLPTQRMDAARTRGSGGSPSTGSSTSTLDTTRKP